MGMMADSEARFRLSEFIQQIKRPYLSSAKPRRADSAAFHAIVPGWRDGETINRLFIILCGPGCWYALSPDGPCASCGFLDVTTLGRPVSKRSFLSQLNSVLETHDLEKDNIRELDLYNAGSFFNDAEISPDSREAMLSLINELDSIQYVLVDCHARDVDLDKLGAVKRILSEKVFEVGIGLESSDDYIRNVCVNKNLELECFERAARTIKKAEFSLVVYVLFKHAFLAEREAIEDAIRTISYTFSLAKEIDLPVRISIEPAVIQGMSLLPYLYEHGLYEPPWLWSVVEVVKETGHLGEIRVGVPEEEPPIQARPRNLTELGETCACNAVVSHAIERFNMTQSVAAFDNLPDCDCHARWRAILESACPPLRRRVEDFIRGHT